MGFLSESVLYHSYRFDSPQNVLNMIMMIMQMTFSLYKDTRLSRSEELVNNRNFDDFSPSAFLPNGFGYQI